MKNANVKQQTFDLKIVRKSVKKDIKLDLDRILDTIWYQGLPNGILNGL